jgi:DNA-binding transcriptional LysR family regulator
MGFRFDLTDLHLFVEVADAGSITAGAERSHLSLASASARILGMEETLGVPLLERARRGVTLTPAGRVLLTHARAIMLQTQRMSGELGDFAQGLKGRIRLACNSSAIHEHLPKLLGPYLMAHPQVNVQVVEALGERIVQSVAEGSADVGIVAEPLPAFGLEKLPFRIDRMVLVTPCDHPLAQAGRAAPVPIFEAELHDIVGLVEGSALQDTWDEHAARRGVRLNYRVRMRSFEAQCRIIEQGVGVAMMPEPAARRYALSMKIEIVQVAEDWLNRRLLNLCMRSLADLPAHTQRFIEHLRADA